MSPVPPMPPRRRMRPASSRPTRTPAARNSTRTPPAQRGLAALLAIMVGFQIIYLAIPPYLFSPTQAKEAIAAAAAAKANPALAAIASANAAAVTQPDPVARTIKVALLVLGFAIIVQHVAQTQALMKRLNLFFKIFLCLVPLSYVWSISPGDTLTRYASIVSQLLVCLAFCAGAWNPHRFQNVLRPVLTLLLVGSVIYVLWEPVLGIENGEGTLKNAWRGLTVQKNQFGQLASFGAVLWVHAGLSKQAKLWQTALGCVLSFTCLVLSRSSTSLMATVFASLFMLMSLRSPPSLRRYMPYLVVLLASAVLIYALTVLNVIPGGSILLEPIAAITGKDTTFSARSEIWRIVKEHIQLAPLLGSGYGAYWIGPVPTSPSYTFLGQMYFYPTESHNGYLEMINDLGYVGLICLIGFLATYIRQALQLARIDRPQGVLFLGMFFAQAIVNLSESTWLAINAGFVFPIMTLSVVALARSLMDQTPQSMAERVAHAGKTSRRLARRIPGLAR